MNIHNFLHVVATKQKSLKSIFGTIELMPQWCSVAYFSSRRPSVTYISDQQGRKLKKRKTGVVSIFIERNGLMFF